VEAGVFPNDAIRKSFEAAQRALAPSVRFIAVDGKDEAAYRQAWQAADVFVSLSDNIQETFGLTPVEAMAAGLPVIVSDWDGYKDTVRDGIDGFRVPTVVPPPGGGGDLAVRHALGVDTYDFYIGRASLATVVSPDHLRQAVMRLAEDSALRQQMGAAGRVRALAEFDWPVILRRYDELARELSAVRSAQTAAKPANPTPWPQRADPFHRFAHFASTQLSPAWRIKPHADLRRRLAVMGELSVANYGFDPLVLPKETLTAICDVLEESGDIAIGELLGQLQLGQALGYRAVLWLWKFDLIGLQPQA
jgi:hypothetical protein